MLFAENNTLLNQFNAKERYKLLYKRPNDSLLSMPQGVVSFHSRYRYIPLGGCPTSSSR